MERHGQTTEEMIMRAHYLNALDIESRAEKPLADMERQDYIDTINDLRNTIESLRMTMATLQATIDTLNRNARRQEAEAARNNELIDTLKRQNEYLESLNSRHNKHRFGGMTLSQKSRTVNKKKGRDEEKEDYTGPSDNKTGKGKNDSEEGSAASGGNSAGKVNPDKVKSEGMDMPRGSRGKYVTMDAAQEEVLMTTLDGAPSNWKFKEYKDVEEYTKVSYVKKVTFKVAVFIDEFGDRHDYYAPKDPEDPRRPAANVIPGTHCTPELFGELASDHIQLHIPVYRESVRHETDKFQISRNTNSNWLTAGFKILMPVLECMKKKLFKVKSVLNIDETWTRVRIKFTGDGTRMGHYFKKYIWCVVNKAEGIAFFFYDNDENDSRGLRPIQKFLEEFKKGTIQSDAYSVYELLTNGSDGIGHLLCWAHVRNKFEEAFLSTKDTVADWFVKTIAELYRIENECLIARMSTEKIKERRGRKDVGNILKSLYRKACEYLNHKRRHFSEMTRKAMEYMKNGWEDLIKYRDDGRYTIDNLVAERAIRPFTGLRKNVQLFGSEDGVKETCLYLTLCETCKNLGVNFKEYITYAISEIIHGNTDYESLTPWAIKVQ